jgi:hypothetical protein
VARPAVTLSGPDRLQREERTSPQAEDPKHAALAAAAERTAANPGSSEVVDLASHRITSVHRPSIELLVNNVRVAAVNFELQIELVVKALVVTVRKRPRRQPPLGGV